MTTLGERIRQLREAKGISQTDFADKFNVTRQAMSNYEKNYRTPKPELISEIADYFNVDMKYLLGQTDKTTVLPETLGYFVTEKEKELIDLYRNSNQKAKDKLLEYARDLNELYTEEISRESKITYLQQFKIGAYGGLKNFHKMTDEELDSLYAQIKEEVENGKKGN